MRNHLVLYSPPLVVRSIPWRTIQHWRVLSSPPPETADHPLVSALRLISNIALHLYST